MAAHSASTAPIADPADPTLVFLGWLDAPALVIDNQARIDAANPAFEALLRAPGAPACTGCSLKDVCPALAARLGLPYFARDTTVREFDIDLANAPVSLRLQPFFDGQRHLLLARVSASSAAQGDITDRMQHQARRDHLTGLPNRLALQEELDRFEALDSSPGGGLLFIDLDHFKTVNDSLGHDIGDRLLQQVAERIGEAIRGRGFLARLGGDEFSVLLISERSEVRDVQAFLDDVAGEIKTRLLKNFSIDDHTLQLGVSIGIAQFNHDVTGWASTFNEADMAMYEAKAEGRNRVLRFDQSMRTRLGRVHSIQSRLEHGLENEEFYLHVQPQYGLDRRCIGGESLLRWDNVELGGVSPGEFIPVCEQTGFIHRIGYYVFEQAFQSVADWSQRFGVERLHPLAVNVSARQFQRIDFIDDIEALLARHTLDPALIQFELTESLLLENPDEALEKLQHIKQLGFSIAIDDFGTGYSCLSYISKLPIGKLKIDQHFTQNITASSKQAAIVETIIAMARNLEMGVIAEGVETEQQLQALIGMGCTEFQGYLFSRPIGIGAYEALIAAD